MSTLWGFLRNRFSAPSLQSLSSIPIPGKVVIVVGASGGLGLEAARHYVRLGASRVILGVRSQSRGEAARQNIIQNGAKLDNSRCDIDVWLIDLTSFASVQAFADKATRELTTIDIVVLNAAVSKSNYTLTGNGWEESIQVNLLSTALLALLVLPKMRQSARPDWKPRLTIVGSRAHQSVVEGAAWQMAPNSLQTLNQEREFGKFGDRYGISKLLVTYAARELAKVATSPDGTPEVIVNYLCPGACKSDLAREWQSGLQKVALVAIQATICKTTEEGSRTLVLATGLGDDSHGLWLHNDRIEEPGRLVINAAGQKLQRKIWAEVLHVLQNYGVTKR